MTPLTREQIAGMRALVASWRVQADAADMSREHEAIRAHALEDCADELEAVLPLAWEVAGD